MCGVESCYPNNFIWSRLNIAKCSCVLLPRWTCHGRLRGPDTERTSAPSCRQGAITQSQAEVARREERHGRQAEQGLWALDAEVVVQVL